VIFLALLSLVLVVVLVVIESFLDLLVKLNLALMFVLPVLVMVVVFVLPVLVVVFQMGQTFTCYQPF